MILYVVYLATEVSVSYNTIKKYLSGLAHWCRENDLPHPQVGRYQLFRTLRGVKRTLGVHIRQGRPIELEFITGTLPLLDPDSQADRTMWAAMVTSFYAFLRKTEASLPDHSPFDPETHLTRRSVTFLDLTGGQRYVRLRLVVSKSVPPKTRVDIYLCATGTTTCPYNALHFLMERHVNRDADAPLFQNEDGGPFRHAQFLARTRDLLHRAAASKDIDPMEWTGTSYRAGGCSAAFAAGIDHALIKMHGRWRSDAYLLYAHLSMENRLSVTRALQAFENKTSRSASPVFDSFYARMKFEAL